MQREELAFYGGKNTVNREDYKTWPSPSIEDLQALSRVVAGEKYHRVNNPIVTELEEDIKKWTGFETCRALGTGTAAIHVGMEYYVKKCEKIIVSALNWPGAVAPVYFAGGTPVYVDVDLDSACPAEQSVLEALDNNTNNLIFITHLFGNMAYLAQVRKMAATNSNVFVFDDCSQGMAISKVIGNGGDVYYTDAIAFSGNGAKHLASGELGVLLSNDKKLMEYVDYISLSSSSRNGEREFSPFTRGYNYRPNVFSSAIALYRLKGMEFQLKKRYENVVVLYNEIKDLIGLVPVFNINDLNNNFYGVPFRLELEKLGLPNQAVYRDYIVELIHAEGVPISVWLKKFVWEYLDYERSNCNAENFPNANLLLNTMFYITEIAAPNTAQTMKLYARAINKVWDYLKDNTDFIIEEIIRRGE